MQNNGISSVEDIDLFISKYEALRADEIILYSLDSESRDLEITKFVLNNPPYEKFRELCHFLETRDYNLNGPIKGLDLRRNGFAHILGSFNLGNKRVTNCYHQDLDIYAIQDNEFVNFGILSSRLVRIEIFNTLLPHLKDNIGYKYSLGSNALDLEYSRNQIRSFSEFLQYAKELERKHPYINLITDKPGYNEFFPTLSICIDGRPYIDFRQANIRNRYSYVDFRSIPRYSIADNFYDDNRCEVWDHKKSNAVTKKYSCIRDALDHFFSLPKNHRKVNNLILSDYKANIGKELDRIVIFYDWVKNCYCFDKDSENRFFGKYIEKISKEKLFCKYTSMDTLKAVIDSGKMRLNTIVAMNDPTEVSKLDGEGCNFYEKEAGVDTIQQYANCYYLTSFTTLKDDLNMWRFYGNNAEGVCMIFEPIEGAKDPVCDVYYLKSYSKVKKEIQIFLNSLKDKNIRFCIQSFVSKLLFIKPDGYKSEKERRLVIPSNYPTDFALYPNNMLVPYLELKLPKSKSEYDSSPEEYYPLILKKIILGPAMKNKEELMLQLKLFIDKKLPYHDKIDVEISKIDYYRK